MMLAPLSPPSSHESQKSPAVRRVLTDGFSRVVVDLGSMDQIHKVMQQKLGKNLDAMKTDILKDFPDEDPEILLMHSICDKYGLTRPKHQPLKVCQWRRKKLAS